MGTLDGKVAFITGIARGQGRAHALRLAAEGADIIGVDICANIDSVEAPLASKADLDETVAAVEALGRRIIAQVVDVRDRELLAQTLDDAVAQLGRLDIVIANAGILAIPGPTGDTDPAWDDETAVMINGVYNTVRPAIPHLSAHGDGGSIIITSSTAGLRGLGRGTASTLGYVASKHAVVGMMREWAIALGHLNIRVNTIHPTGVMTPMVVNEAFGRYVQKHGTFETVNHVLPVGSLEAEDVADTVAFLVSDAARYITGQTLSIDAGVNIR